MFEPDGQDKMRTVRIISQEITTLPGVDHSVVIPPGYVFDGASIPRVAWSIIGAPFEPDFVLAACIHDWYCEHSYEAGDYQARVIGDAVFFKLLAQAKVSLWRRMAMYLAVRFNSWWRYGRRAS